MKTDPPIYTIRPDRTPLYLPPALAAQLGLRPGDRLTVPQYESAPVQALISERLEAEKGKSSK